jgi:nicotinamidase/pyrazinamidase
MSASRRAVLRALVALPVPAMLAAMPRPADAIAPDAALVVVDVQRCFTAGGSLAVPDGDAVVPLINSLARRFTHVILTQDWHTADHASFASQHPGRRPFESVQMPYGPQTLWPDHCVMGTDGAGFHPGLDIPHAQLIVRKGWNRLIDSYSAFLEADRSTRTGLDGYLNTRGLRRLFIAGLATDYCVGWTALDARRFGFEATVIEDACRAIDLQGSLARAWAEMAAAGVRRVQASEVA